MTARNFGIERHAEPVRWRRLSDSDRTRILAMGLVASTLYLAGVFVAGLVWHRDVAVELALATAGICYASAFIQFFAPQSAIALAVVAWSVVFGAGAGFSLIW